MNINMKKDVKKVGVRIEAHIHPFYWAGFFMAKTGQLLFTMGVKIMKKYNIQVRAL